MRFVRFSELTVRDINDDNIAKNKYSKSKFFLFLNSKLDFIFKFIQYRKLSAEQFNHVALPLIFYSRRNAVEMLFS